MHVAQHTWKAALSLGLGIALSCGPAQGANGGIAVSATILARNACRFTNDAQSQLAPGNAGRTSAGAVIASVSTTFRCTGPDAVTTYRIRSNAASGTHSDPIVATVEP